MYCLVQTARTTHYLDYSVSIIWDINTLSIKYVVRTLYTGSILLATLTAKLTPGPLKVTIPATGKT